MWPASHDNWRRGGLVYNGKNSDDKINASAAYPLGTYTVGKVVFDPKDLHTVVSRSDKPFLVPSLPHELTGQYKAGTTFAEGLVFLKANGFYIMVQRIHL